MNSYEKIYDIKIVNGFVINGEGQKGRSADVGIRDGKIVEIAENISAPAKQEIDAAGHVVCPGFIDLHTHASIGTALNYLQQGATLLVTGNCGFSSIDIASFAAQCVRTGLGPNLATLIGHNSTRSAIIGNDNRQATAKEMDRMKRIVAKGMEDGAVGFSTGLIYVPGTYTKTEEIIELAKAASGYGGYYVSHMRDESDNVVQSLEEAFRIGRESGLPVQISHHKVEGASNWGRSPEVIATSERARGEGLDVTQDQYPYTAASARIGVLMPTWACAGDKDQVRERFSDPKKRREIKDGTIAKINRVYSGDLSRIVIASSRKEPALEGKNLAEISGNLEAAAEFVINLAGDTPASGETMCVYHSMSEEDVVNIMKNLYTSIGSDGWVVGYGTGKPHPRLYGTFPRVLGKYCREMNLFPIEEAIRKMTALPAQRLELEDRGVLKEGNWADVVVFDKDRIIDKATFLEPHQYPEGIDYVIVNGKVAVDHGKHTGEHSGVFIERSGS